MSKASILVVDDESEIREGLELLLTGEGYGVSSAGTGESGLAKLGEHPFDLLLLDVSLPDRNGLDLLKEIHKRDPHLSIVLITAYGSIDMARTAFKSGAMDYITKPWSNDELLAQVAQAVESRQLREENVQLKRALKQRFNFPNIIGKSDKMHTLLDLVTQVAPSRSTVLISGESGTGKELIAKAIHSGSTRADKAFVPVNTGSIPVDLLESQLFGHVKGAFTSAVASKKGLFEVADQGTIFFDEIATISPETQAKLLRVIQEREFMRLGGTEQLKVDVRIVAASNVDLLTLVREGRFREDLYHRLNVIHLQLPPLRDRREDVPLLLAHFLERYCKENEKPLRQFTPGAMKLMMDYDWPGNVRELGERCGTRGGALDSGTRGRRPFARQYSKQGDCARSAPATLGISATAAGRARVASGSRPFTAIVVSDYGRNRAPNYYGYAGTHGLEPDGSGGKIYDSAIDAQSEDQAPGHRCAAPRTRRRNTISVLRKVKVMPARRAFICSAAAPQQHSNK